MPKCLRPMKARTRGKSIHASDEVGAHPQASTNPPDPEQSEGLTRELSRSLDRTFFHQILQSKIFPCLLMCFLHSSGNSKGGFTGCSVSIAM